MDWKIDLNLTYIQFHLGRILRPQSPITGCLVQPLSLKPLINLRGVLRSLYLSYEMKH
jgi:hypothetical protein